MKTHYNVKLKCYNNERYMYEVCLQTKKKFKNQTKQRSKIPQILFNESLH